MPHTSMSRYEATNTAPTLVTTPVSSTPISGSAATQSNSLSGAPGPAKRDNVAGWQRRDISALSRDERSKFDSILIIQLEDNEQSLRDAINLASKHPKKSVLLQLDAEGNSRLIHGDLMRLTGYSRWHFVGRSRGGEDDHNPTSLAGYDASGLLSVKKQVSQILGGAEPNEIVLIGSALASDDENPEFVDYRTQFADLLNQTNTGEPRTEPVGVVAYTTTVDVDEQGRRLTLDDDDQLKPGLIENRVVSRAAPKGLTSVQWMQLIRWMQEKYRNRVQNQPGNEGRYMSSASAEAYLKLYNFPPETRLRDYDMLLGNPDFFIFNGRLIEPGPVESHGHHSITQIDAQALARSNRESAKQEQPVNNEDIKKKWLIFPKKEQQAIAVLQSLHPDKNNIEIDVLWKSFNMSGELRQQLVDHLITENTVPEWAEAHKSASMDSNNTHRFDHIRSVVDPMIARFLRSDDQTMSMGSETRQAHYYAPAFLNDYLRSRGYQINDRGYPFRRDISGVFRGTHITPYEIVADERLLPFHGSHPDRTVTEIVMCGSALYRVSQENYTSGKSANISQYHYDRQSDPTYREFSDSDSDDEDYDHPIASKRIHKEYSRPLRRGQTSGFIYWIDTRGLEVVSMVESYILDPKAVADGGGGDAELHISAPFDKGIPADRIWLIDTEGNRALNIADLGEHFHNDLVDLEEETLQGASRIRYDRLFGRAEAKGLRILDISSMTSALPTQNNYNYDYQYYSPGALTSAKERTAPRPKNIPGSSLESRVVVDPVSRPVDTVEPMEFGKRVGPTMDSGEPMEVDESVDTPRDSGEPMEVDESASVPGDDVEPMDTDENVSSPRNSVEPSHHVYEIAVVQQGDADAIRAVGQWLRKDPMHRYLVVMNGEQADISSPNGTAFPMEAAAQAWLTLNTSPANVQVLFVGEKKGEASPNVLWNDQSLLDTRERINRFINKNLTGVSATHLQIKLGQIIITDLDEDGYAPEYRIDVGTDYVAQLAPAAEGRMNVTDLIAQPRISMPTGLPGGNSAYADPLSSIPLPSPRDIKCIFGGTVSDKTARCCLIMLSSLLL